MVIIFGIYNNDACEIHLLLYIHYYIQAYLKIHGLGVITGHMFKKAKFKATIEFFNSNLGVPVKEVLGRDFLKVCA